MKDLIISPTSILMRVLFQIINLTQHRRTIGIVHLHYAMIRNHLGKSFGTTLRQIHWPQHLLRIQLVRAKWFYCSERSWLIVLGKSFSSSSSMNRTSSFLDRRISIPDMSKLSSSSAAMVASMGPTIDKLKQWSRTRYKCTKQSIFEKLGKTSRTVDVELDAQIEVNRVTFIWLMMRLIIIVLAITRNKTSIRNYVSLSSKLCQSFC